MAITKLIVWNTALTHINDKQLADTTTATREQSVLNRFWETAYQTALQAHTWSFQTKVADLTVTTTTPDDWAYEYELPSDLLRIIEIPMATSTGGADENYSLRTEFAVRDRAGTNYLYCDVSDAELRYIYDPGNDDDTDLALWTYPFMQYCAAELAVLAIVPLTGSVSNRAGMRRVADDMMMRAIGLDQTTQRSEMSFKGRYARSRS